MSKFERPDLFFQLEYSSSFPEEIQCSLSRKATINIYNLAGLAQFNLLKSFPRPDTLP